MTHLQVVFVGETRCDIKYTELQIVVHSETKIAHLLWINVKTVKVPPMFYRVEKVLYFFQEPTIIEHECCLNMLPVDWCFMGTKIVFEMFCCTFRVGFTTIFFKKISHSGYESLSLLVGQEKIAEMFVNTTLLHQTTQLGLLDGSFYAVLELHSGPLIMLSDLPC